MVPESVFGTITVGTEVETAVMAQLAAWMPTVIQEIELQYNRERGKIPPPKMYTTRNEFTSFPTDILPLCVVVSPGLADPPTKDGEGVFEAWWTLGVGFAAEARDADAAGFLAKVYGAAGRKILLTHQSLGGVTQKVVWVDESYDDLVVEDDRTVRATYLIFRVLKGDIVTEYAGPAAPANPATQPGSTWPTANIVKIDGINVS